MSSPVDDPSHDIPKRPRGRPRKEFIEQENLSKMLRSKVSNALSRRFLQKMALLNVLSVIELYSKF